MRVTVTMDAQALRTLSRAQAQALAMTAQQVLNEVRNDAVIPFDTGATQNEGTSVDDSQATAGKASIVTDTPYARKLYFHPEYNFNQSKNANARGEWWEDWLNGSRKNRPRQIFSLMLRRTAGRYMR
jgi:hypothetical protein